MADTNPQILIKIPGRGYEQLAELAAHSSRLKSVVGVASEVKIDADFSSLVDRIAENTKIDEDAVERILGGLSSLRNIMSRTGASAGDLVKSITDNLPTDAPFEWKKDQTKVKAWQDASQEIASVLEAISLDHPLLLRQKVRELTYVHQNIFRRSRIITDLRPVFSASADSIRAMVLTHVLSIEYFDGENRKRIEFALDESDIEDLLQASVRAQEKTRTTRKSFRDIDWILIVAGEPDQETE